MEFVRFRIEFGIVVSFVSRVEERADVELVGLALVQLVLDPLGLDLQRLQEPYFDFVRVELTHALANDGLQELLEEVLFELLVAGEGRLHLSIGASVGQRC